MSSIGGGEPLFRYVCAPPPIGPSFCQQGLNAFSNSSPGPTLRNFSQQAGLAGNPPGLVDGRVGLFAAPVQPACPLPGPCIPSANIPRTY